METSKRRAYLQAMVELAETDHTRLRALDLLDRLDERDRPEPPKRPDVAESYADAPDRLARLVELHVELGCLT